jgi:hypothetical protein
MWSHIKTYSESMEIVKTNHHPESVRALCHRLLGRLGLVTCRHSPGTRIGVLGHPLGYIISSRRLH